MNIFNYFKPISTMSPEKVRQFLEKRTVGNYNLVDVRTPKEYEQGHLPGARLIPVGEISKHLEDLDPHKPTILY